MSYVSAEGPDNASIVLVGEAPGGYEAKLGRPFVGRSGKLLNLLLAQAGILREQCYVTNVIKERPPGNNIKPFIDLSKRQPKPSENAENYIQILQTWKGM